MGRARPPQPVKLICGLLSGDAGILDRAVHLLSRELGAVDARSSRWPFEQTDYYAEEMGPGLLREFVSFERLIRPDELASIKRRTNEIEATIAEECEALEIGRPVNLDPGYVHPAKLVLATTKDAAHRVYLGERIYAEATLRYQDGRWNPWPWTYPDYHQPAYHEFFTKVRTVLRTRLGETDQAA